MRVEVEVLAGPGERVAENVVPPLADLFPDRVGPRPVIDHDQLRRFAHGQRLEDQAVEDREERGVGADSQRQRQYGNDRDDGTGAQRAERVADIYGEQRGHGESFLAARDARGTTETDGFDQRPEPENERGRGAVGVRLGVLAVQRVAHARFEARAEVVRIAAQQNIEPAVRRGVAHQA